MVDSLLCCGLTIQSRLGIKTRMKIEIVFFGRPEILFYGRPIAQPTPRVVSTKFAHTETCMLLVAETLTKVSVVVVPV